MSTITISQYTASPPSQIDANSELSVRGWYSRDFIATDGVTPVFGNASSGEQGPFYETVPTLNGAGNLVVPAHEIQVTVGANPTANYFEGLWVDGTFTQMLLPNNNVTSGWQIPSVYGDPIAYDEIATYNRAKRLVYPPETYFTADQVIQEIERILGTLSYMAVGVNGIGQASFPPIVASAPIVLMENDPRVGDWFNVLSDGAVGNGTHDDTSAVNATIAAALAAGGGVYIPVGTFAINNVNFTVPIMFAPGNSILKRTGGSITIGKAIIADRSKHFIGTSGQITFGGNVYISEVYPEWWGAIADASTDCTAAFNAAIGSFQNNQPGVNGGILKLGVGNYRITGLTITDQQIHIIGSGSGGDTGSSITASTIISSVTNSPIIKYAYSANIYSYNSRLEHLVIAGNNTGSSQHGIWVDNNGIRLTDVSVQKAGGQGLYLTHSNIGRYTLFEAHNCTGDGIRFASSQSANAFAGTNENVFVGTSIGDCARGVHFLSGHGNMFFGLDTEHNLNQGVYFDNDAGAPSAVTYNNIYGLWSELDIGPGFETQGTDQNNYVQLVRIPDVAPVINSSSVGDLYDTVEAYGTAATRRLGRLIVGSNAAQISGADGIKISTGDLNLSGNSSQRIRWGATFPQIGISSTENIILLNAAGTGAGSLNLGPSTSGFVQFKRNTAGVDIRNGDDSAYGFLTAKSLMVDNTGKLNLKPKTNDTYSATVSIDVSISNHIIQSSFTTSGTSTFNASSGGTAGDVLRIITEADASGTTTVTFGTSFKSSGTQATTASHFSSITFDSDGNFWIERCRTTNLA